MSHYDNERAQDHISRLKHRFYRYCMTLMFLNSNNSQLGAVRLDECNLRIKFKG